MRMHGNQNGLHLVQCDLNKVDKVMCFDAAEGGTQPVKEAGIVGVSVQVK